MFGEAFDGSGKLVNREVPKADVQAFQNAGYQIGEIEEVVEEIVEEKPKPKFNGKKEVKKD